MISLDLIKWMERELEKREKKINNTFSSEDEDDWAEFNK